MGGDAPLLLRLMYPATSGARVVDHRPPHRRAFRRADRPAAPGHPHPAGAQHLGHCRSAVARPVLGFRVAGSAAAAGGDVAKLLLFLMLFKSLGRKKRGNKQIPVSKLRKYKSKKN